LPASKTYKKYGNLSYSKAKVVDDLTFGAKRGEVFALLGPNGGMFQMFKPASTMLTIS
jgi:ABC-type multidrug transport system ATPase subunit